ncbi:MAG: hypothetical protein KIT69_06860 [Propionibacteriaceae bacterium]|nr:hypothetical protein [Propionibacteriaceae bacterium]
MAAVLCTIRSPASSVLSSGWSASPGVTGTRRGGLVCFEIHPDLTSFTGVTGRRIVEPGRIELGFARSSSDLVAVLPVDLTGPVREVDHTRVLHPVVRITTG